MPAKNADHDLVCEALVADGWTITADPLRVQFGGRDLYIDLAAEQAALTAEKEGRRIAVEIQSFSGVSDVRNLQEAAGQFGMYRLVLRQSDPDRRLYMAVEGEVYNGILSEPLGQAMLAEFGIALLVYDPDTRRVVRWTN
jgi:hypothetical protein